MSTPCRWFGALAPRSMTLAAIAWGYILFSLLILALTTLPLLPAESMTARLDAEATSGGLSAGAAWLIERGRTLALLLNSTALVMLLLAVALLMRRRWARYAFITLMMLGIATVLGSAALTPLTFSLLPESADAAAHAGGLASELITAMGLLIIPATLLIALFAWTGWTLTTPAIRAEFQASHSTPES